ncbi:winged helix DNA-binding domain-containing protein [Chitinophaga lutea]
MKNLLALRLHHLRISHRPPSPPAGIVSHLCAMQGQDYASVKWSIGLRAPGLTDDAVEAALADRSVVRISSLRGTLHCIAAEDVRWINALVQPRARAAWATFYKSIGMDEEQFAKAFDIIRKALKDGQRLSRDELKEILEKKKMDTSGHRMNHIISRAGIDLVICCAPRRGKEFTYTLAEEWLPPARKSPGGDLSELARRYLVGRGPATEQDFAAWSGFPVKEARAAFAALNGLDTSGDLRWFSTNEKIASVAGTYLLPGFDEYFMGYADRSMLADEDTLSRLKVPNGILQPIIVSGGRIAGTWKRTIQKKSVTLEAQPFKPLPDTAKRAMVKHSQTFGTFLGLPAEWI